MTDILKKKRGRPRRGHSIETSLKKALTDRGLRPQDLEWVFSRSATNVCNILNGNLHLSLTAATAFSSYLGRDLNSLFELEQRLIHRRIVCVARAKPLNLSRNLD